MTRYRALAVRSRYWRPGTDYRNVITGIIGRLAQNGDIIVISEKAIAMALGRIYDESRVSPFWPARFLAAFWVPKVWGYLLGPLSRMSKINIERLREYPREEGARHKQVALNYAGVLQALKHGSEGGIDVSNLPYAYACLPLLEAAEIAKEVKRHIRKTLSIDVDVMIVDSDKTYSFHNFHMAPRPSFIRGIHCLGIVAFVLGRFLRLRPRSTPLALTPSRMNVDEALRVAAVSNKIRGSGAGKTIWDVAQRFNVGVSGVSWEMLDGVPHYPIVIVRRC